MSSPPASASAEHDDPMVGVEEPDEEEDAPPAHDSDDSSEEPEEDEDEERRIREGFIVDEEEDEEEEQDNEEVKRKRKKRKRRHHRDADDDGVLEEDDLELLEENTGGSFRNKNRLTRLRRGRDSESPPVASSSKRKAVVVSEDEDLDADDLELPQVQDIHRIWDDERAAAGRDDDEDLEDDMDNFIDYDDEEEGTGGMDEEEREERRRERRRLEKERRRALGSRPELTGIDANAWDEIHEVFGDGHDYDWALVDEDEDFAEEQIKPEMNYHDVFEPSEIKARLLTEDDDLIRAQDIPERMQLATSTLSSSSTLSMFKPLAEEDLDDAATWVLTRLSQRKERDYFRPNGQYFNLLEDLVGAITLALRFLFVQEFEVPYIWAHKRDYVSYPTASDSRNKVELLNLEELWRVYALGQKYRSFIERKKALEALYDRLGVTDEYFDSEIRRKIDGIEMIADATEWLGMRYSDKKKEKNQYDLHFHDDAEEPTEVKKRKLPSNLSAYELTKKSIVSKLAEGFGIKPQEVVINFASSETAHFVEDQDLNPEAFAEQFADPDPLKAQPATELLRRARMLIATELGKDPLLRQDMRSRFKTEARISVLPTERGINKIDEHHPYFAFKYLFQKPVVEMLEGPQFLHILAAEAEHLVTVFITLPDEAKASFERRLQEAFSSDSYSDNAKAWNAERMRVVSEAIEQHLIPVGAKWTREWLREEVEDLVAWRCAETLRDRIDVAPFKVEDLQPGETPSVLAMSWGKGDPHKDAISMVFLDEAGRLRDHTKIDNLSDADSKAEFEELVQRRKPDVIAIGGFSMATTKLSMRVKEIIHPQPQEGEPMEQDHPNAGVYSRIAVTYVLDEVARIYQHSKRVADEFSALSPIAKYCVGLARYVQSPLNEYAALGPDITTITFEEDHQQLVPREKLLTSLERAFVDVVNKVGVDVNRAVMDPYYQHLLPFVCGLGPRKAQVLVKKIAALGGNLLNRDQFIKAGLLTTKIFLNAASFLKIPQDNLGKSSKRHNDDSDLQDPLDSTRIHPEDYDLARKMATDALELDEEDVHGEHPSHVVTQIMNDPDNVKKLDELNLDEFAFSLMESGGERKRHVLNVIRSELIRPYFEARRPLQQPGEWEVLTMLSGETERTLRVGLIVSVLVLRTMRNSVTVRLDSGIEGIINSQYLADQAPASVEAVVKKGQTLPGVIIDVKLDLARDSFLIELSSRPTDVAAGDSQFRRVKRDDAWNHPQWERDKEMQARKKRAEVEKSRRVIKHPNFHNFNSSQAEAYLDKQQRGDVVIRPSSKGLNHLAVTWKVDDKLYQHIDVVEPNADPTGQSVGGQLIVEGKYEFSDLDELIVNHVQAMARRVEELMAFDKFKAGPEDELHLFLKNFVAANPSKSAYGFTLNRKRPGHFNLCFLANKNATVQTWPVRVAPEAYYLFDTPAPGVPELCDAFKVRHLHESQNLGGGGAGGKTPYSGRTPARTPGPLGSATPGRMSVRQIGRTPNPYAPTPGGPMGGTTPAYPPPPSSWGMPPPQTPYGYQTPAPFGQPPPPPPPNAGPPGMNPQRAALIQNSAGAWNQNGSAW
ncbi:transcription elongation factor Spt6 [Dentipellis sp. KUC8613]|nr:transcription elongation factor Spt6 [Dentipellis sp. KUC8613]